MAADVLGPPKENDVAGLAGVDEKSDGAAEVEAAAPPKDGVPNAFGVLCAAGWAGEAPKAPA